MLVSTQCQLFVWVNVIHFTWNCRYKQSLQRFLFCHGCLNSINAIGSLTLDMIKVTMAGLCMSCSASLNSYDMVPYQLLLSPCQPSSLLCGDELANINQESDCVGGSFLHRLALLCVPSLPFQNHRVWELLEPSASLLNHYVISQQSNRSFLSCFPLRRCRHVQGWMSYMLFVLPLMHNMHFPYQCSAISQRFVILYTILGHKL